MALYEPAPTEHYHRGAELFTPLGAGSTGRGMSSIVSVGGLRRMTKG